MSDGDRIDMLVGMKRLVAGWGKLATAAIQQVEEWTGAKLLKAERSR